MPFFLQIAINGRVRQDETIGWPSTDIIFMINIWGNWQSKWSHFGCPIVLTIGTPIRKLGFKDLWWLDHEGIGILRPELLRPYAPPRQSLCIVLRLQGRRQDM